MTYIHSYGCSTDAGSSSKALWKALTQQKDTWPLGASLDRADFKSRGSKGYSSEGTLQTLSFHMGNALRECLQDEVPSKDRWAILFTSTKGMIEELLSKDKSKDPEAWDPVFHLWTWVEKTFSLQANKTLCISHACSSHGLATYIADLWLDDPDSPVEDVLIIGVDAIGPFIYEGFRSLNALASSPPEPMGKACTGLVLSSGASCVWLKKNPGPSSSSFPLMLSAVATMSEGDAITRPSPHGRALAKALDACSEKAQVPLMDVVIPHATGTPINDPMEMEVLANHPSLQKALLFPSKWCTGHSLAASGGLDFIVGCMILENQYCPQPPYPLHPRLEHPLRNKRDMIHRVGVLSMGFGGVASCMVLSKSGLLVYHW